VGEVLSVIVRQIHWGRLTRRPPSGQPEFRMKR
jgi:hypothetical protein